MAVKCFFPIKLGSCYNTFFEVFTTPTWGPNPLPQNLESQPPPTEPARGPESLASFFDRWKYLREEVRFSNLRKYPLWEGAKSEQVTPPHTPAMVPKSPPPLQWFLSPQGSPQSPLVGSGYISSSLRPPPSFCPHPCAPLCSSDPPGFSAGSSPCLEPSPPRCPSGLHWEAITFA